MKYQLQIQSVQSSKKNAKVELKRLSQFAAIKQAMARANRSKRIRLGGCHVSVYV